MRKAGNKGFGTMKKHLSSVLRLSVIAGVSVAIFAGAAEAAPIKSRANCMHMWKAYKTSYQAHGKTRASFLRECRAGTPRPSEKGIRTQ
jgi:hypothetical protein